jgi:hypothetical protein
MGCSQVVRHWNLDPTRKGSNPFTPVVLDRLGSSVVEQRTENPWVRGSNPLLDIQIQVLSDECLSGRRYRS